MFKAVTSLTLIALFAGSLWGLNRVGKGTRISGEVRRIADPVPVHVVRRTRDVYDYWQEKGFRNRIVVHLGKYLHFVEFDSSQGYRTPRRLPLQAQDVLAEYRANVSYLNFLWAAVETDIAREVYNVLPPDAFRQKVQDISQAQGSWYRAGNRYVSQYFGSLRVIAPALPREREPVLLNIDASFCDSPDVEGLVREVRRCGLLSDAVTLCLSEDSPDVTQPQRDRLQAVAKLLQQ